jgi:DNA-binding response OmpR family regulator
MQVLLIEDNKKTSEVISNLLTKAGIDITATTSIEPLLNEIKQINFDLILLDLMLENNEEGIDLVRALRKNNIQIPIVVLTGITDNDTKVELLEAGVDDYICKPYHAEELLARIRAVHRRYLTTGLEDQIEYDTITFYWKQNKVKREDHLINLTKKEAAILQLLLKNKGKTVPKEELLEVVWKTKAGYHSNLVQATIRRLRNKVDRGFKKQLIKNVHGIGYQLCLD